MIESLLVRVLNYLCAGLVGLQPWQIGLVYNHGIFWCGEAAGLLLWCLATYFPRYDLISCTWNPTLPQKDAITIIASSLQYKVLSSPSHLWYYVQVVMLDEHGLDVGSEQVAELIGDAGNTVRSSTQTLNRFLKIHIISLGHQLHNISFPVTVYGWSVAGTTLFSFSFLTGVGLFSCCFILLRW